MSRKTDLYKILEAYKESKEKWVLFIIYDYSQGNWVPARVRYKLTPLEGLDKEWRDILDGMNEDHFHHTLGNKSDKEIRSFGQPITDDSYKRKQAISANISTKKNLLKIIDQASDDDWTEIVDLKPETKKHFGDIVGHI